MNRHKCPGACCIFFVCHVLTFIWKSMKILEGQLELEFLDGRKTVCVYVRLRMGMGMGMGVAVAVAVEAKSFS